MFTNNLQVKAQVAIIDAMFVINTRPLRQAKTISDYATFLFEQHVTHLLFIGDQTKKWPRVTKPIMVGKTPCKLLCAFGVKVSNK